MSKMGLSGLSPLRCVYGEPACDDCYACCYIGVIFPRVEPPPEEWSGIYEKELTEQQFPENVLARVWNGVSTRMVQEVFALDRNQRAWDNGYRPWGCADVSGL